MAEYIRLSKALEWVNSDDNIADVGCDHGYFSIMALGKGVSFVQLIDNKEGPLSVARANVFGHDDQGRCMFTLGDGLKQLDKRVNKVAILGMGGELIAKILSEPKYESNYELEYILGPNTKTKELRIYLMENNFVILDESILEEKGKIYELIYARRCKEKHPLTEKELMFGPILMKERSPLFIKKWTQVCDKFELVKKQNKFISSEMMRKISIIKETIDE